MITFKKIDKFKYIIESGFEDLITEASDYVSEISFLKNDNSIVEKEFFATFVNDKLLLEILNRLITKHFISKEKIENDVLSVSIEYVYNGKICYTSIGYMTDLMDETMKDKYVDALLIK